MNVLNLNKEPRDLFKRFCRFALWLFVGLIGLSGMLSVIGFLVLTFVPSFGAGGSPDRSAKLVDSSQYDGHQFTNTFPGPQRAEGDVWESVDRQFFGTEIRTPPGPIPFEVMSSKNLSTEPGLRAYWLGHASVLIEIDGKRFLVDPVFSDRVSPFEFVGPQRFHPPPIALEDLPPIDGVLISHDHYDHLDMLTAQTLTAKGTPYFVPLGIAGHLKRWGVPDSQIIELDWGDSQAVGGLSITSTPAQHYSGRGLLDQGQTLWSSWVLSGLLHRVFYSGDTGFSPHFEQIGERYGPFDLTIMKIGAYGPGEVWHEIHMTVEQSIQAHLAVKGKRMLPVHWGTFNLAFHAWDEPIKRAVKAAAAQGVNMVTPKVGEKVESGVDFISTPWWQEVGSE